MSKSRKKVKKASRKPRSLPEETKENTDGAAEPVEVTETSEPDVNTGNVTEQDQRDSEDMSGSDGDADTQPDPDTTDDEQPEIEMEPRVEGPGLARAKPNLEFCEEIRPSRDILDIVHEAIRIFTHAGQSDGQVLMVRRLDGDNEKGYVQIWFEAPKRIIKRLCRTNNHFRRLTNVVPSVLQKYVRSK